MTSTISDIKQQADALKRLAAAGITQEQAAEAWAPIAAAMTQWWDDLRPFRRLVASLHLHDWMRHPWRLKSLRIWWTLRQGLRETP